MTFDPSAMKDVLYPEFLGIGVSQDIERMTSVATTDGEEGEADAMSTWDENDLEEKLLFER